MHVKITFGAGTVSCCVRLSSEIRGNERAWAISVLCGVIAFLRFDLIEKSSRGGGESAYARCKPKRACFSIFAEKFAVRADFLLTSFPRSGLWYW